MVSEVASCNEAVAVDTKKLHLVFKLRLTGFCFSRTFSLFSVTASARRSFNICLSISVDFCTVLPGQRSDNEVRIWSNINYMNVDLTCPKKILRLKQ